MQLLPVAESLNEMMRAAYRAHPWFEQFVIISPPYGEDGVAVMRKTRHQDTGAEILVHHETIPMRKLREAACAGTNAMVALIQTYVGTPPHEKDWSREDD